MNTDTNFVALSLLFLIFLAWLAVNIDQAAKHKNLPLWRYKIAADGAVGLLIVFCLLTFLSLVILVYFSIYMFDNTIPIKPSILYEAMFASLVFGLLAKIMARKISNIYNNMPIISII